MAIRYEIYEGYKPDNLELIDSEEMDGNFHLLKDAAWKVLGDHIAAGPSDAPYIVEAQVWKGGNTVRVHANVDYVDPR